MRYRAILMAIVLTLATFAIAQQPGSTGSTSGSGDQTTSSPSDSGAQGSMPQTGSGDSGMSPSGSATDSQTSPGPQSTSPGASSSAPGASTGGNVVEGCLGGTAPNFTVTSTEGTVYKLDIPANADTAAIAAHIGEGVQVSGAVNNASGGSPSIQVERMGTSPSANCSKSAPSAK